MDIFSQQQQQYGGINMNTNDILTNLNFKSPKSTEFKSKSKQSKPNKSDRYSEAATRGKRKYEKYYLINNLNFSNGNILNELVEIGNYQGQGYDNRISREALFLCYKNIGWNLNGLTTLNYVFCPIYHDVNAHYTINCPYQTCRICLDKGHNWRTAINYGYFKFVESNYII